MEPGVARALCGYPGMTVNAGLLAT
jgi:hypothetical protein